MQESFREHDAYRAAGQALAATLHGAPIDHVEIVGIEVICDDVPDIDRPRDEILADIANGLAGVVAEEAFGFGICPDEDRAGLELHCFNQSQLDDFAEDHKLVAIIDPDATNDVFFRTWNQALDLIAVPDHWRAVVVMAELLVTQDLDPRDLAKILEPPARPWVPLNCPQL